MLNRYTSIKRTMALAGAVALSAGSFAFMLDTNIVIERALNSPTLTVKYDGANATLVELRINGESLATKSVSATANKGETTFTLAVSDLKDGDNDVEVDHGIGIAEGIFLVPDEAGGMAEQTDGMNSILIAVRRGELEDGEVHQSAISSL